MVAERVEAPEGFAAALTRFVRPGGRGVVYTMNSRSRLRSLFEPAGFHEEHFAYLDDCRTFHRFRSLNYFEMSAWRALRMAGVRYPENCLLGVYRRCES